MGSLDLLLLGGADLLLMGELEAGCVQVAGELGALLLKCCTCLGHRLRHRKVALSGAGIQLGLERGDLCIARGQLFAELLLLIGGILLGNHALALGGDPHRRLALLNGGLELGGELGDAGIRLGADAHELGCTLALLLCELSGAGRLRLLQGRGAGGTGLLQL